MLIRDIADRAGNRGSGAAAGTTGFVSGYCGWDVHMVFRVRVLYYRGLEAANGRHCIIADPLLSSLAYIEAIIFVLSSHNIIDKDSVYESGCPNIHLADAIVTT